MIARKAWGTEKKKKKKKQTKKKNYGTAKKKRVEINKCVYHRKKGTAQLIAQQYPQLQQQQKNWN